MDVWVRRQERVNDFAEQWQSFALQQKSWVTKWQKSHSKAVTLIDRCNGDVRSANRDTLLPVTLQCYRIQLKLEQEALTNEREIIRRWPGIAAESRTAMLERLDALSGAIQPVIDAIDAKVFPTLDAFRNVRANLLTQYRQPFWLQSARFRADAALIWTDSLLISLHTLMVEETLSPALQKKILAAQSCYETAEPVLESARNAETIETARKQFAEASLLLAPCPTLLREAQTLWHQTSSASFR